MKTSTLQSLMSVNARIIFGAEATIRSYVASAKGLNELGEKAFALADDKEADKYRKILAKLVKNQVAMKAEVAYNNSLVRIDNKKSKLYGAQNSVAFGPSHTSNEIESALDEAIAIKFPAKADSRPADHPSLQKAAK